MSLSLDGVRVLELARYQAGPRGGMILSDLGAEVIKIERIGGEETRKHAPMVRGHLAGWPNPCLRPGGFRRHLAVCPHHVEGACPLRWTPGPVDPVDVFATWHSAGFHLVG